MKIDVEEIKKISVKEGDVVIFTIRKNITAQQFGHFAEWLKTFFEKKNVETIALIDGDVTKIQALSKECTKNNGCKRFMEGLKQCSAKLVNG